MDLVTAASEFIAREEGCRLVSYRPLPSDRWTIGYGYAGPEVHGGMKWPQAQADAKLREVVGRLVGNLQSIVEAQLRPSQWIALTSLVYNIGMGAFLSSTLLRYLNEGRIGDAAEQFHKWVYSGGKKIPGLVNRRNREYDLFVSP